MKKLADISLFESYSAQAPSMPCAVTNTVRNPLKGHFEMLKLFIKGLSLDDSAVDSIRILVRQDKKYAPLLADVQKIQAKQRADYKWYIDTLNDIIESESKRLKALPIEEQDPAYIKEWERGVAEAQAFVKSLHVKW
jgi:hypothetical protein